MSFRSWSRRRAIAAASAILLGGGALAAADPPMVFRFDAPAPECATCRGLGIVPIKDRKLYVHVEGTPAPKPEDAVRAAHCPTCRAKMSPKLLVEIEAERLKTAFDFHKELEQAAAQSFVRVETHHGAYHLQLPPAEAQKIGPAVEMLTAHLQQICGSMGLTVTDPTTYNLFMFWEKPNFDKFKETVAKRIERQDLTNQFKGFPESTAWDLTELPFCYDSQKWLTTCPPVHHAVAMTARRQMDAATEHRAPTWLLEGFTGYGEYAVFRKNRIYFIYDVSQRLSAIDWMLEARSNVLAKKNRPWDEMIKLELRDLTDKEYVQSFSMVVYLLQTEPKKFLDLVRQLRAGKTSAVALEAAYGGTVAEIDAKWVKWVVGR